MLDPGSIPTAGLMSSVSSVVVIVLMGALLLILWQVAILFGAFIANLWRQNARESTSHLEVG